MHALIAWCFGYPKKLRVTTTGRVLRKASIYVCATVYTGTNTWYQHIRIDIRELNLAPTAGDATKPSALLRLALQADSTHVPAMVALGTHLMDQNEWAKAAVLFRRAEQLQPTHVPALVVSTHTRGYCFCLCACLPVNLKM
jgi:cytochrome c-type biogenesis protein CcmH/NrfG